MLTQVSAIARDAGEEFPVVEVVEEHLGQLLRELSVIVAIK
jgi:hypothetical protein